MMNLYISIFIIICGIANIVINGIYGKAWLRGRWLLTKNPQLYKILNIVVGIALVIFGIVSLFIAIK